MYIFKLEIKTQKTQMASTPTNKQTNKQTNEAINSRSVGDTLEADIAAPQRLFGEHVGVKDGAVRVVRV